MWDCKCLKSIYLNWITDIKFFSDIHIDQRWPCIELQRTVQEQRCLRWPCSQRFRCTVTTEASYIVPLMYEALKISLETTFSPQSAWELQSVIQISPLFSGFWHHVTTRPKKQYENLSNQCSVTIMGAMICSSELQSFSNHIFNT